MGTSLLRCTFALVLLAAICMSVASTEDAKKELPHKQDRDAAAPSVRGGHKDIRGVGDERPSGSNAECDCRKHTAYGGKPKDGRSDREGHDQSLPKERVKEDGVASNSTNREKFFERNSTSQHQGKRAEWERKGQGATRNANETQGESDKEPRDRSQKGKNSTSGTYMAKDETHGRSGKEPCDCSPKGKKSRSGTYNDKDETQGHSDKEPRDRSQKGKKSTSGTDEAKDIKSLSHRCRGQEGAADQRGKSGRFLRGEGGGDDCDEERNGGITMPTVLGIAGAGIVAVCVVASLLFLCCRRPVKTPATAGVVVGKVLSNV